MQSIEGLAGYSLAFTDQDLVALRYGGEQARRPLGLFQEQGVVRRHDKGRVLGVFGRKVEAVMIDFGFPFSLPVPLERRAQAQAFTDAANAAIAREKGA